MLAAAKNRRELIAAGLTSRRDLFRLGLLTAGGVLVAKSGLSARAAYGQTVNGGTNQMCLPNNQPASPRTSAFIETLVDPIYVQARFGFTLNNKTDYRLESAMGGGALLDIGFYVVSIARWILGEPSEVLARSRLRKRRCFCFPASTRASSRTLR